MDGMAPPGTGAPGAPGAPAMAPGMVPGMVPGMPAPSAQPAADLPPCPTLYVNNINERIKKGQLKKALMGAFSQFGVVVDIKATKTLKLKGQAWVTFSDTSAATTAMRQMQGYLFFNKPLRIQFSREKSDAAAKRDGTYVPKQKRQRAQMTTAPAAGAAAAAGAAQEEDADEGMAEQPAGKRQATEQLPPNKLLFVQGLPAEYAKADLEKLFGAYTGLSDVRMVPGGRAFVEFTSDAEAAPAKGALDGFKVTATDAITVEFAK